VNTAIIPLAGKSSRFAALTSTPKWALKLGDTSILELALESLTSSRLSLDRFVFVVRLEHMSLAEDLIRKANLCSAEFVSLQNTPNGQALSVEIGLRQAGVEGPFLVWNGDTHLKRGWDDHLDMQNRWMLLSELLGDHWSFASTKENLVTKTSEKIRISSLASLGLYAFASSNEYLAALEKYPGEGEQYVAPLYNFLIAKGLPVQAHIIESSFMVPLGTPDEVAESCRVNNWPMPKELSSRIQ
jgi:NDP-sugar pyrophosphorylase family protein